MTKSVLTIGNFDGVHRGHRALIQKVLSCGGDGGKTTLMTFDPHPAKILAPQREIKCLFSLQDRLDTIRSLGIENILVVPFDRALSQLGPEDFFKQLVIDKLLTTHLVVGHDFNFGRNRAGTHLVLNQLCKKNGVQLEIVEPFKIDGETVSSSAIREALSQGEIEKANKFLGRSYYLEGIVEKGAERGRELGFPTANLFTRQEVLLKKGVYLTWTKWKDERIPGVTNIGENPTFNLESGKGLKVETHCLNFKKDVYGEKFKVHFIKRLRDEKKFSSVAELKAQISRDVSVAQAYNWSQVLEN